MPAATGMTSSSWRPGVLKGAVGSGIATILRKSAETKKGRGLVDVFVFHSWIFIDVLASFRLFVRVFGPCAGGEGGACMQFNSLTTHGPQYSIADLGDLSENNKERRNPEPPVRHRKRWGS